MDARHSGRGRHYGPIASEAIGRSKAIGHIARASWLVARSSLLLTLIFLGWSLVAAGLLVAIGVAGMVALDWLGYVPMNAHIRMG